jgi:predicted dehydrogenase
MSIISDPNEALTVAILGAGQVGQKHAQAFASLGPDVKLLGIVDTDAPRANSLAASYGTRAFTDYQTLLALSPDITVICLPHHLHGEVGVAAAQAGSHILMEKPLAPTLAEAWTILAASRQYGVHLTVSFVHRYRSEFQRAHQLISNGELGTLSMILDVYGLPGGQHIPGWVWQSHEQGGGILMYSGIHSLDWQRWLVGSDVVEVFAQVAPHSQGSDAESSLAANLRFTNGCLGALIGNQPGYLVTPRTRSTEIYGSKACLKLRAGEYLEFSSNSQAYRLEVTRDDPFVAQAREFVAAVREQRDPWIMGEDGLQAQATVLAIFRSAESGQPVAVADVLES